MSEKNRQPDIDICTECGEHAEFDDEGLSNCCGSRPYDSDPDIDMERRTQTTQNKEVIR